MRILLFLALIGLASCSGKESPSRSWDVAAQGVFTGELSNAGDMLIVGSLNHGASLWRTPEHERLFNWSHETGEFTELVAAGFSPDATRAITTDPRTLVLWDTTTGEALSYWATPGAVLDVAVFNDNRLALLGLDNHSALVFDAETGDYQQTLLHQGVVGTVDVSMDGQMALTGSDDNTAVLWNLNQGEAVHTFKHDNPVRAVALSASGNLSFTAAQGDLVAIWDNNTGQKLHELHNGINHGVMTGRFSADERLLVIGYTNRQVGLVDVATGSRIKTWDPGTKHAMSRNGATVLAVGFNERNVIALTGDGRLLELRPS